MNDQTVEKNQVVTFGDGWILVTERFPSLGHAAEDDKPLDYFVFCASGRFAVARPERAADSILWTESCSMERLNVTHWMPLPDPPEDK